MSIGLKAAIRIRRVTKAVFVCGVFFVGMAVSCKRSSSQESAASEAGIKSDSAALAPMGSLTPIETVRRVQEYRASGQLSLLEPYLLAEQRAPIIELLQSMDQLIAAGAALQAAVEKHIGTASAEAFDRSGAADILGAFSKHVEILREEVNGETAKVTIQVAQRVPLESISLVRRDGHWVIREEQPIPGVAEALRGLARIDAALARELAKKKMTAAELHQELKLRRAPIQRRLAGIYQQSQTTP